MKLSHKFFSLKADVDEEGVVSGYASKFGVRDEGGDIVAPGAFSKSLNQRKPKMLWQHDPWQPIGVWEHVKEDDVGLKVMGRINLELQNGREIFSNLKFGAVDCMSIGYHTRTAEKIDGARLLKEIDLFEISFVTFPMLPAARIESVKDFEPENIHQVKRFAERILREAEFSADEAKAAAAALARVRSEREAGTGESDRLKQAVIEAIRGLGRQ